MNSCPIIASITDDAQITAVLNSPLKRVNLMTGHIGNLSKIMNQLRAADKQVFIHIEMVGGLGRDKHAVAYLAEQFQADGIITTKPNVVAAAKQAGLRTIQRIFAIDSAALQHSIRLISSAKPDEVELMPGLMPRVIKELKEAVNQPLIAGGLIRHEHEISEALHSGADFVSCGDPKLWHPFFHKQHELI